MPSPVHSTPWPRRPHDADLHLHADPLTAAAFAPFGDVIDAAAAAPHRTINAGRARRYDDLARIDTARDGGRTLVSLFRTSGMALPWRLEWMERHQLGSQAFVPLHGARMLIVVAAAGPAPTVDALRCFVAAPGQGVNYAAGTWHQPLVAIRDEADVLVIDRGASAPDCDEHRFGDLAVWISA